MCATYLYSIYNINILLSIVTCLIGYLIYKGAKIQKRVGTLEHWNIGTIPFNVFQVTPGQVSVSLLSPRKDKIYFLIRHSSSLKETANVVMIVIVMIVIKDFGFRFQFTIK